jgi:tetratricopeptide (TPR) repeat protein
MAILMSTSRGIILAIVSAFGVWIVWRMADFIAAKFPLRRDVIFPSLVLLSLSVVILLLYAGPASSGGLISTNYPYGTGSRAELFARSIYLALDFPFTGGGLAAFPGLYSYYMLGIPFFNVVNSHNLFLDVAIEQGLIGGLSFLIIFLMAIWFTARALAKADSRQARNLIWLLLFALVIAFVHGMVDYYLYHGNGTFLSLALAGISTRLHSEPARRVSQKKYYIPAIAALILLGFLAINLKGFRSTWNANLGAVQMAKIVLAGFPTGQWTELARLPQLEQAEASLHVALQGNPTNRTANHRLGLISLLRGDFSSAAADLENAHQEAPDHRGIMKALGYCYAWQGDTEKAVMLLSKISEAKDELDVYIWWWAAQGRPDLAEKASHVFFSLKTTAVQE